MASFNRVILLGNLTRDPDYRKLPALDMATVRFSIATNRVFYMKNGERKDEVTYVDIDAYGKAAEAIARYFRKGSAILVEGRLHLDQWEDKTSGEKRARLGVVLESFSFVDKMNFGDSASGTQDTPPAHFNPHSHPTDDGNVPF
ncbi:MAG: single-stranded DNA-binding protein [Opitutales bacterium]|nr:single-stranded DNA-binding protein [Opitutales bacterium]